LRGSVRQWDVKLALVALQSGDPVVSENSIILETQVFAALFARTFKQR